MTDPNRLDMARIERDRRMRKMTLCECEWPLVVYRNGDGHQPGCPAHSERGPIDEQVARTKRALADPVPPSKEDALRALHREGLL